VKDNASLLLLFFSLGDEDELDWPNGGGNIGLFINQPRNENLEGGFLVFGVEAVVGILMDTSSDFLTFDFEDFFECFDVDFDLEIVEVPAPEAGGVSASEELIA